MASVSFESLAGGTGNDTTLLLYDYESLLNLSMFRQDDEVYARDLLTYYIMGVGGMTLCCLGLVGNMLSLVVLTQRSMRSSTYSYLSALAVCDSLMLLLTIILLMKDVNRPVKGAPRWAWDEGIYPYLFPYVHPGAFTFQVTSVWLTLAFTVDRYIMICHPFKAEPFCNVSRARKVVCSLYILAFLFNLPKFFEYETVAIHLPMQNGSNKIGWDLTSFGRSHVFRELYHSWFYIAFVCGVPFMTLAVLNGCLMYAVHLSRLRGREINVAEKKRNDTTVMLISVVVVFFICQMPALVSRTIWAFEPDQKAFHRLPLYTLNEMGNLLIIMNSSINIVPYYFFGRRFRRNFWKLFCRCLLGYEKFQKLSRSFSLTVFDHRRPSQAANNSVLLDRSHEPHTDSSHQTPKDKDKFLLSPKDSGTPGRTVSESSDSLSKSNNTLYKQLSTLDTQINGNCVHGSKEKVYVQLLVSDIKNKSGNEDIL